MELILWHQHLQWLIWLFYFYFYTEWFKCRTRPRGAYYLDLWTSKDLQGLEKWKNGLTLKCSVPQAPVVFFLQCIICWPHLVVFNYKRGMVLLLGKGNNVEEFVGHQDWNQWNGEKLWTEISATMGWLQIEQNPRIIEANWIPVSYQTVVSVKNYFSNVKCFSMAWILVLNQLHFSNHYF